MEALMTKNNGFKKAAHAYQHAHPELTYQQAKRAVAYSSQTPRRRRWAPGQVPWVRTNEDTAPTCYFCGERELIISATDMRADRGRVAMYCDNPDCDAREFEVIVMRDGTASTPQRTDVRIMEHYPHAKIRPMWEQAIDGAGDGWAAGTAPYARTGQHAMECLFCGEQSCAVAEDDVSADTGRIRFHCNNSSCAALKIEVLAFRDGTGLCGRRPDVKALHDINPTRARDILRERERTGSKEPHVLPVSDYYTYPDGVDPLQARLSAPAPWEET